MRAAAAVLLAFLGASPVWAGASSAPFPGAVDPALRTATPGQIEGRFKRSCISTQVGLGAKETRVHQPCGCYAAQLMVDLSADEMAWYRQSGVFIDSARPKALAAIDSCGLRRPV